MLNYGLQEDGNQQANKLFFDTLRIHPRIGVEEVKKRANEKRINLRYYDDQGAVGVSLDETVTVEDVNDLFYVFGSNHTVEELTQSA